MMTLEDVPQFMDTLDILLISIAGEKAGKTYTDLEEIRKDWAGSSIVYKETTALFNQGNVIPTPERLIREVTIVRVAQSETASTLVEVIKAYQEENDDQYIFLTDRADDTYLEASGNSAAGSEPAEAELSSGVEDHRKLYVAQTNNKEYTVSTARTMIVYTKNTGEHADAAWLRAVDPWYPQSVTWKFRMPAGISVPTLTTPKVTALEANHTNFVTGEYEKNYIENGIYMDGERIDAVLGANWIAKRMRERPCNTFMGNPNIPCTDASFTTVSAGVFEALEKATRYAVIAESLESGAGIYNVSVPKRSEATDQQTASGQVPNISWEAQLEGTVYGVKAKGILKVSPT